MTKPPSSTSMLMPSLRALNKRPIPDSGDDLWQWAAERASYEARRLGIFTTMPTTRARKICPDLVLIPGDFEQYERFSRLMFSYAYDQTPLVEVTSIDEGYFDLRGRGKKSAWEIAGEIREAIQGNLKIPVSDGGGLQ
jgi:DNA polymerase-4